MDEDKRGEAKYSDFVGCLLILGLSLGIMAFFGFPFVTIPAAIILGGLWLYRGYRVLFKGDK